MARYTADSKDRVRDAIDMVDRVANLVVMVLPLGLVGLAAWLTWDRPSR